MNWIKRYINKNLKDLRINILRELISSDDGSITSDKIVDLMLAHKESVKLETIYQDKDNKIVEEVKAIGQNLDSMLKAKWRKDAREHIPLIMNKINYVEEVEPGKYVFNGKDITVDNKVINIPSVIGDPINDYSLNELRKKELDLYKNSLIVDDINIILHLLTY